MVAFSLPLRVEMDIDSFEMECQTLRMNQESRVSVCRSRTANPRAVLNPRRRIYGRVGRIQIVRHMHVFEVFVHKFSYHYRNNFTNFIYAICARVKENTNDFNDVPH